MAQASRRHGTIPKERKNYSRQHFSPALKAHPWTELYQKLIMNMGLLGLLYAKIWSSYVVGVYKKSVAEVKKKLVKFQTFACFYLLYEN